VKIDAVGQTNMPIFETILKSGVAVFRSPRIAVTVFLGCSALLFGSRLFPQFAPLAQQYKLWIMLAWLASGIYSITFPIQWLASASGEAVRRFRAKRHCIGRLHSLTTKEKHLLQEHLENNTRVVPWSVNRLEISSLAHDGILMPIQQRGAIGYFRVADVPWNYLLQHPDLVATPGNPRPARLKDEWMI